MGVPVSDVLTSDSLRLKTGADIYSTAVSVAATARVSEDQNFGVPVRRTYGDGRQLMPILTATPGTPLAGQYWLEHITGTTYFRFVDQGGTIRSLATASGSVITPVSLSVGANTVAQVNCRTYGLVSFYLGLTKGGARAFYRVDVAHDGTTSVDATTTQLTVTGGVSIGTIDCTITRTLTGTGAGQEINLVVTPSSSGWYSFTSPDIQIPT